jgi:hypothetical protein
MRLQRAKPPRKRRSRIPAGMAGARLVMDELLRRGLDVRLADTYIRKYEVLIESYGCPPKPVHVRIVHASPWYVRSSHFVGAVAKQVTVYVLLGLENNPNCARFFVTRNSSMETELRQPPDWLDFAFIDVESVEIYEDNWDLLES